MTHFTQGPELHQGPPPLTQPAAEMPPEGPAELEQETPNRKRAWQVSLVIVLLVALVYAVANFGYFMARTYTFGYRYPAGQDWTYDSITFTVTERQILTELPPTTKNGKPTKPDPGAVFVRYHVKVDGFHYDPDGRKANDCEFALEGSRGQQWSIASSPGSERKICDYKNPVPQQDIYPIFEVPERSVEDLKGIKLRVADPRPMPLLREPQ